MENSEILGFQFEPTKTLQPDSCSGGSLETCSPADSEASTTKRKKTSVDTWCMCFNRNQSATKECMCYHELNACEYFKIKRPYVYLLPILQIFFIKLINKHGNDPKLPSKPGIPDFGLPNKIFRKNLCVYAFMHYHNSSLTSVSLPIIT